MSIINGHNVMFENHQISGLVEIDEELSLTSENPVQNKVVAAKFQSIVAEHKSANLFDNAAAGIVEGSYIRYQDGDTRTNANYLISDFIPIEGNKTYSYKGYRSTFGDSGAVKLPLYDADKNYIGYTNGAATLTDGIVVNPITAIYPTTHSVSEVAFTKINVAIADLGTAMFVEAEEYPSEYEPYGETKMLASGIEFQADHNILYGKKVVFAGDSICAAGSDEADLDGWCGRIGKKNRMQWENKGIAGNTITKDVNSRPTCICETDFGSSPDYIILEGGTNDADLIGNATGETKPAAFGSVTAWDFASDFDKTKFCGAVENLIKRVVSDYKGAKIGFIIAQKMGLATAAGHNTAANRKFYFDTIIDICKKWGVPVLNLWDNSYLNPSLPAHYTSGAENNLYTDGQHLTAAGYDIIAPVIEEWMRTL